LSPAATRPLLRTECQLVRRKGREGGAAPLKHRRPEEDGPAFAFRSVSQYALQSPVKLQTTHLGPVDEDGE
jgi:hypothetical protein